MRVRTGRRFVEKPVGARLKPGFNLFGLATFAALFSLNLPIVLFLKNVEVVPTDSIYSSRNTG